MTERDPGLDGLRGIAIALVVVYHYLIPLLPATQLTAVLAAFSSSGVDLFFVLSGYLLGGILLDNRQSAHYFRAFYGRRLWRTLPLYAVVVMAGASVAVSGYSALNPVLTETLPWWSYVTLTQNITRALFAGYGSVFTAVTWSLALEEQFYLVLPWVMRARPTRRVPLLAALAIVVAPAFRILAAASRVADPYTAAYAWPLGRVDVLLLGVLSAWGVRHWRFPRSAGWLTACAVVAAGVAAMTVVARPRLSIYVSVVFSALAVCYGAVLLRVVTSPVSVVSRLCHLRWLRWAGIRAYGIYLFHIPVVHAVHWGVFGRPLLNGHGIASAGASAAAVLVTLVLAHLSWEHFEYPLVAWSRAHWSYATRPEAA